MSSSKLGEEYARSGIGIPQIYSGYIRNGDCVTDQQGSTSIQKYCPADTAHR